ncbi:hypothetical protein DRP07_00020 [Archaeoglobales archaeon]|nr:MAG: hypothetical protein DRP07_00020 [Archaeoglobales archaeon]
MGQTGKMLLVALVVAALAVSATWLYMNGYITTSYQQGYQAGYTAGQAATTAAVATPVSLTITQAATSFNHSSNVSADGSAKAGDLSLLVTITNNDNESANVVITAQNPKTGTDGIPSALEKAYFNVYAGSMSLRKYLYVDGSYTDGAAMVIDGNSVVSFYIGTEFETAPAGTFSDNQTYTLHIYVYQPNANYVQELTYTLLT